MAFKNLAAAIDKAVSEGADQTQAKTGGGGIELPAEGPCNLRLVAYIELGKHERNGFNGGPKKKQDMVTMTFELSGKNHPPVETDNGVFPQRITITENHSLNEKARFFKLFQLLNYKGTVKHAAALLGEAFRGRVVHEAWVSDPTKKSAKLFDKKTGSYTISPPRVEVTDEDGQPTGEYREIKVAPAISEQRCFLWNYADMEQWASLFIDGEYEERKDATGKVVAPAASKNKFQLQITSALNYKGSPIQQLLTNGGAELTLPEDGVVVEDDADDADEAPAAKPAPAKPVSDKVRATPPARTKKADPLAGVA
jgi:hypothetical protein